MQLELVKIKRMERMNKNWSAALTWWTISCSLLLFTFQFLFFFSHHLFSINLSIVDILQIRKISKKKNNKIRPPNDEDLISSLVFFKIPKNQLFVSHFQLTRFLFLLHFQDRIYIVWKMKRKFSDWRPRFEEAFFQFSCFMLNFVERSLSLLWLFIWIDVPRKPNKTIIVILWSLF